MKTQKMSFKNILDVLSRDEMKKIMAGSGVICSYTVPGLGTVTGPCADGNPSTCMLYCEQAGHLGCTCTPA